MTMTHAKVLALALMLAVSGIAIALILAATARADTIDDLYLSNLHSQGISSAGGDANLIAAGHLVCAERADGMSGLTIARAIEAGTNLDPYSAGYLVGSAEGAYCPWAYDGPPTRKAPTSSV